MNTNGGVRAGEPLLEVDDLGVEFLTRSGTVHAVRGVSFEIRAGEVLGLVGESGSGKSVTAQAILGLVDHPGHIVAGDIRWKGESLIHGKDARRRAQRLRGRSLSAIFQDPMTALNPTLTVGTQLCEMLRHHLGMSRADARARSVELLHKVRVTSPERRLRQYPHELSGGMRQRVMIAMALSCEPELLIADEPTTALDVTIQAQIMALLSEMRDRFDLALLLITHDLGVVAGICDRVAVMYSGRLMEVAPAEHLFGEPGHPYSVGLIDSTPRVDVVLPRLRSIPGAPPDARSDALGCPFAPRCPVASEACERQMPDLLEHRPGRSVACWRPFDLRPSTELAEEHS